ncbi:MAG TPA: GvpL/GvpF family gas vesicle protein [Terriglobales bacterium]|nr:GvpL/GvpF family gas vesicle protein [Terriglobales bacterium]
MAWYAYCITEQRNFQGNYRARRPFPIEGLRGVGGAQVIGYPSGDFAVIASEYVRTGTLDQKCAVEHARVIGECFRSGTVLPFKFGTVFDTDEAMRQAVRNNRKTFLESVAHLRGKSEMHVKVVVPKAVLAAGPGDDLEVPAAVGSEYLTKLRLKATRDRERQTKARALSLQVHKLFNPIDEEITCKQADSGALLIDIAHLIDSKMVEKYQNRLSTATKQLKDCEIAISGPWPPYHFMPDKLRLVNGNS